jgi:hypothetical protein
MPNWVINSVSLSQNGSNLSDSNPALWEEIVNFVKTQPADLDEEGAQDFDFRSIVPQPAGLYDDVDVPQQSGLPDWYSWCCEHWGTKWNASDPYNSGYGFTFNTAWSTPLPVIEALSNKFPTVIFTVHFADEDLGNNCGSYAYENGERIYEEIGTYEFACDMWGYEPEEEEEEVEDEE